MKVIDERLINQRTIYDILKIDPVLIVHRNHQARWLCDQPDDQKVEFCDQISRPDRLIRAKGKYRHSSAQPLDHGGRNNDFPLIAISSTSHQRLWIRFTAFRVLKTIFCRDTNTNQSHDVDLKSLTSKVHMNNWMRPKMSLLGRKVESVIYSVALINPRC